jgi:hypothetical protein
MLGCPFSKCKRNDSGECVKVAGGDYTGEFVELVRVDEVECECPKCGNVFLEPCELLDCKSFEEE